MRPSTTAASVVVTKPVASSAGAFGAKLRKLASSLSPTAQQANMNEFVLRFFNPSIQGSVAAALSEAKRAKSSKQHQNADDESNDPPAATIDSSSSSNTSSCDSREFYERLKIPQADSTRREHGFDLERKNSIRSNRSVERSGGGGGGEGESLPVGFADNNNSNDQDNFIDEDHLRSSAPDMRERFEYSMEGANTSASSSGLLRREQLLLQQQQENQQQHPHPHHKQHQQQEEDEEVDKRTLVEVFDQVLGTQIADQPDDDVITIVVRNDSIGRKLFRYLVACKEMFFLPLLAVDATSIPEESWQKMKGAKIALDALARPVDGAKKLCLESREDLPVYHMPSWSHGVGCTLESFRQSIVEKTSSSSTSSSSSSSSPQEKQEKQEESNNNNNNNSIKLKVKIPTTEECFQPSSEDVLSVPFEPNGMRLFLANGHQQLQAMNLHALSDKRQTTEAIEPVQGEIVANRFRIDLKVGSATFSDAFAVTMATGHDPKTGEALFSDVIQHQQQEEGEEGEEAPQHSSQPAPVACIKVVKPEFFDQALDEVRLLNSINETAQQRYEQAIQLVNDFSTATPEEQEQFQQKHPEDFAEAIRAPNFESGADFFHVVRLADAFYYRHRMFVVTELLKENLYETCVAFTTENTNNEPYWFNISRLGIITKQITRALALVHSLDLIHCDLKPENIMVQSHSRCRVKLIDYGSSAYTHERFSSYVQSRSYRAPEVVCGAPYDSRADVWSLGAVLVELAARGEILFRSTTLANMMARIVSVCGPLPPTLMHSGYHADCLATRSGVLFSTTGEIDDERFEKFEQHPYFYTARNITSAADINDNNSMEQKQQEKEEEEEEGGGGVAETLTSASLSSSAADFEEASAKRNEVWLHFPVFSGNAQERKEAVNNRQELWKKKRSGDTNAEWFDIYEHSGRIEAMIEKSFSNSGLEAQDETSDRWLRLVEIANLPIETLKKQPVAPEFLFLDFVKKCMILDPTERPTTEQLLHHPFIKNFGALEEDSLLAQFMPSSSSVSASQEQEHHHHHQEHEGEGEHEDNNSTSSGNLTD